MIIYSSRAESDIDRISAYIAADNLTAALRFAEAVRASARLLHEAPRIGHRRRFRHPELTGLRSWRVKGFDSYLLFYKPVEGGIRIVSIVHGARDLRSRLLLK